MITLPRLPRLSLRVQFLLSALFMGLSIQLLSLHTQNVRQMRDIGLPAALLLPDIERRMDILKQQSDVVAMQGNLVGDSNTDMLHMYVLPGDSGLDRLLATVDAVTSELQREGVMTSLSPVHVGDASTQTVGDAKVPFTVMPVSFEADVTDEGLKDLFHFQDLAGLLTISDALTPEEQTELLHLTEAENPAAVTALESFLATDLLTYANNADSVNDQLLKSFTSDSFATSLKAITQQSKLEDAVQLLSSPLGKAVQAQKLWPLRFVIPADTAIRQTDATHYHVAVTWQVYHR
jgi:hypothetical protein